MDSLSNNLRQTQGACFLALRTQLRNLEATIASLLQLATSQPQGSLREQLMDRVSELDSIADVMRQALDGMNEGGTGQR